MARKPTTPWYWPRFAYAVGLLWDTFWAGVLAMVVVFAGGAQPTLTQMLVAWLIGAANYVRTSRDYVRTSRELEGSR